ncbi:UNVERIFIED_CONTAM: hypothetical protein FKN15_070147 [Acipenser sinensis]
MTILCRCENIETSEGVPLDVTGVAQATGKLLLTNSNTISHFHLPTLSKCTDSIIGNVPLNKEFLITLEIMTLGPKCEDVETAEGVALTVTGVAQVKIMTDQELLGVACEQFLGKNVQEIKAVVLQTLEGHLRSILGTLTVEQIYQDRDQFAKLVREVAAPDVGRMGIEILSFTIKDVYDKVEYLSSLGKSQTAAVQRDADIGVAEAERDAGIRDVYDKVEYLSSLGKSQTAAVQRDADIGVAEAERDAGIREAECKKEMMDIKFQADTKMADSKRELEMQKASFNQEVNTKEAECKKEMMDIKFQADTKMADSKRELEMQKASFNQEVNTKKAEAQLAYELQAAKEQQKIRQEEMEIEVVQRKKQITIEEKEISRTEKELIAMVKRPAEAEAYKMQQLAEGEKIKKVLIAQAEAEKIRRIGEAEAASIEAIGKAEAEKMKLKAEAYQQYGDAAKTALVLEALPKIAAKIAAPLAKIDEIVMLSGDNSRMTGEVNRLLAELPVSVHALTGVDLMKDSECTGSGAHKLKCKISPPVITLLSLLCPPCFCETLQADMLVSLGLIGMAVNNLPNT